MKVVVFADLHVFTFSAVSRLASDFLRPAVSNGCFRLLGTGVRHFQCRLDVFQFFCLLRKFRSRLLENTCNLAEFGRVAVTGGSFIHFSWNGPEKMIKNWKQSKCFVTTVVKLYQARICRQKFSLDVSSLKSCRSNEGTKGSM